MTPITFQALRKTFGPTLAVDDVSLTIPSGSLFFLLGPSGCGKTTLLRMIAGFTEPTAGRLFFGAQDVTFLPANQRNTGMVFQGYALWPHMTVAQNVAFGLEVRKHSRSEIRQLLAAALEQVQLAPLAERRINQLSGGQQQRVALARALVIRPTVLLLDEPLSNLDASLRIAMRSSIRQICKDSGITAVYVTHDQKEALSMADSLAVMRNGRIVQAGPPRDLYYRPREKFVACFLGETNLLTARIQAVHPSEVLLTSALGPLVATRPDQALAVGQEILCSIRPEAVRVVPLAGQVPAPVSAPAAAASPGQPLNRFPVTLRESTFLGEIAQHLLEPAATGDLPPLQAFELNPRRPLNPTEPLEMQIDPLDVVILRQGDGPADPHCG